MASLIPWLSHEDRHVRGNAAFTLAALGDPRGFQTIVDILTDRFELPRLTTLLNDQQKSNFGAGVSVAEAAKAAIAKLQ